MRIGGVGLAFLLCAGCGGSRALRMPQANDILASPRATPASPRVVVTPAAAPGVSRVGSDAAFLGINHQTGFDTNLQLAERSIAETRALGLGSARMGMDGVNGGRCGAAFTWSAREAVVEKYVAAGLEVRSVVSFRSHVDHGASSAEWDRNWDCFVRAVFARFKGKIRYYIIDNEPDLSGVAPERVLEFMKIAYRAAREIDPEIAIESSPMASPTSDALRRLIELGVTNVCDFVGTHHYGGQVIRGDLKAPWHWMRQYGVPRRPITCSECGTAAHWAPAGIDPQEWRRRWHSQWYLDLKRSGYAHAMLFSLSGGEAGWEYFRDDFSPVHPATLDTIRKLQARPFANGGFEFDNDRETEWIEPAPNIDDVLWPAFADFVRGEGARSGAGHVRMRVADTRREIVLERIAAELIPGVPHVASAYALVSAGSEARLAVLGYERLEGDAVAATATSMAGGWQRLSVEFTPTNSWAVIHLAAPGTGTTGAFVKWDDVALAVRGGTPVGSFLLRERGGKCLDGAGWGTANGTEVLLWDCHGGDNQIWILNGKGQLKNRHAGRCLDATRVQLRDCSGGPTQLWSLTAQDELRGPAGKCLAVAEPANGARPSLGKCVAKTVWHLEGR